MLLPIELAGPEATELGVLQFVVSTACVAGCAGLHLRWERTAGHGPSARRGRARALGCGIALLLIALAANGLYRPSAGGLAIAMLLLAGAAAAAWPALAGRAMRLALIGTGLY